MPERNARITEAEARGKIAEALSTLRDDRNLGTEAKAGDDNASVDYHVDNIIKAGGGIWNETVAKDYIENLRTQVARELEVPNTTT